MTDRVAAFTDTYLPTVNGVTYTVKCWRDRCLARRGETSVRRAIGRLEDAYESVR